MCSRQDQTACVNLRNRLMSSFPFRALREEIVCSATLPWVATQLAPLITAAAVTETFVIAVKKPLIDIPELIRRHSFNNGMNGLTVQE